MPSLDRNQLSSIHLSAVAARKDGTKQTTKVKKSPMDVMLEWKNIIQTKTKISVKVGNIVDDDDDDETEMSWYEGTPGGSWRDMGARRKI